MVVLLFIVYWTTVASLDDQLKDSVERETQVLAELYRGGGLERVARAVQLRVADLRPPRRYYLLQSATGERVAGNLPPMDPTEGETVLPVSRLSSARGPKSEASGDYYPIVARGLRLDKGEYLLVGESRYRSIKAQEAILRAFGWSVGITLLLAWVGGGALRTGFLRRIEAINRTTRSIMDGNLSQRVPTLGGDDEIDRLALNLNAMLGRIQSLMENVKQVSDDIAHDLRTPLSRLRYQLEEALDTVGPGGRPVVERAIVEMDAILETFSALLRIAQIESGARRNAFAPFDFGRVVSKVTEAYIPVAEDRGQSLELVVKEDVWIAGDRELLTQMMVNLVENPIRHCPASTRITVELRRDAAGASLRIADTGPGIAEVEHEKVFRRFYRLEASRTTPGSGLGLALVRAVAELHGATVQLSDNRPGLCVTVRFATTVASSRS